MIAPVRALLLWLTGSLLLGTSAQAGGLSVLPTRLDFSSARTVQSVLLTNTSAQTVTVESSVMVWGEGRGLTPQGRQQERQQDSDVVVTPAVVTLPPNQRMRVRVGILRPGDGSVERAYRLHFTELPAPGPLQGAGIGVRLRIGIPVFVVPESADKAGLRWTLQGSAPDDWKLVVHNDSNRHRVLTRITLAEGADSLAAPSPYVLARSSMAIPLAAAPPAGARVRWFDSEDASANDSVVVATP